MSSSRRASGTLSTWLTVASLALPQSAAPNRAAASPNAASSQREWRADSWSIEGGLPQKQVSSLLQTRDGYIWVGTQGGLARFDGVRFATFDTFNTPQLYSNRIHLLIEATNGDLLIATHPSGVYIAV
jgi:ligand-binding sensor domain-containing protein